MDAFFVPTHTFQHPYSIRLWTTSSYEGSSLLMTFDGVKIRLYNFLTGRLTREIDYLKHSALSDAIAVHHSNFPSRAIFIMVKERRNLVAWDDQLSDVPSLTIDTSLVILALAWSQKRETLYVSGNFGWIRALKMDVTTSISGTMAQWQPVWTRHDSGQWMKHMTVDDHRGILFGASGTDVYMWNINTDDGQLIMQFNTNHTMGISSIKYSDDRLMFFTASADGMIKGWRMFERKQTCVHTIKQVPLGPMQIEIDDKSLISISQERIMRRYGMMTGDVMGSINLDPSVTLENKNIDVTVSTNLLTTKSHGVKHEWMFVCESGKISMFEVHFAPRELAVCCDVIADLMVDHRARVFALCKNNVVHELYTDGTDGHIYDLDSMQLTNASQSAAGSSNANVMKMEGDVIYFGFESGVIKALNVERNELCEMKEPDIGNGIMTLCYSSKMLTKRHYYCPKVRDIKDLVFSCSHNGGFTIHCPLCYSFIASWKFCQLPIRQIEKIPDEALLIGIDITTMHIWRGEEQSLLEIASIAFDKYDLADKFTFVSDTKIAVAMQSGNVAIYSLNMRDPLHPVFTHNRTIGVHTCKITKMCPTRDLLKIEEAVNAWKKADIDGVLVTVGCDDTLRIVDCETGLVVHRADLPAHKISHSVAFTYQGKIMLVFSIDQNIRLFDWPSFVRLCPSPTETSRAHEEEKSETIEEAVAEGEQVEEEKEVILAPTRSGGLAVPDSPRVEVDLSQFMTTVIPPQEQTVTLPPMVPKEERKYMDLVFDRGYPRLVMEGDDSEVEFRDPFTFNDFLVSPRKKSWDEVMEANFNEIQKIIKNDPKIAEAFASKPVKSIRRPQSISEMNEDQFLSFFLTVPTKTLLRTKKKPRVEPEEPERQARYEEMPEEILPMGGRRGGRHGRRRKQNPQRTILIEFSDGTIMRTNEVTIDLLKKMAKESGANVQGDMDPGLVFRKAVKELKEKAHLKRNWQPIIREVNTVATPIMTLTDGGVAVGSYLRRFFKNKDDPHYEEAYREFVSSLDPVKLTSDQFMHWEGVDFGQPRSVEKKEEKKGIVGMTLENEETEEIFEEEFDYGERPDLLRGILGRHRGRGRGHKESSDEAEDDDFGTFTPENYFSVGADSATRQQRAKTQQQKPIGNTFTVGNTLFGSSDPPPTFNIFDEKNDFTNKLINSSPSLRAFSNLMGASDNPLLDLIQNTPAMTREQIDAQLNAGRLKEIDEWQPMANLTGSVNVDHSFKFEGISDKIQKIDMFPDMSSIRPASPRPMDALNELTRKLNIGGPLLPVISESSIPEFEEFEDFSESSATSSVSCSPRSDILNTESVTEAPPAPAAAPQPAVIPKHQTIVNEHLKRNDFKGLRDLLGDVGLLNETGLIDLPRWQPTCKFLTHHQKALKASMGAFERRSIFGTPPDDMEEEFLEEEAAVEEDRAEERIPTPESHTSGTQPVADEVTVEETVNKQSDAKPESPPKQKQSSERSRRIATGTKSRGTKSRQTKEEVKVEIPAEEEDEPDTDEHRQATAKSRRSQKQRLSTTESEIQENEAEEEQAAEEDEQEEEHAAFEEEELITEMEEAIEEVEVENEDGSKTKVTRKISKGIRIRKSKANPIKEMNVKKKEPKESRQAKKGIEDGAPSLEAYKAAAEAKKKKKKKHRKRRRRRRGSDDEYGYEYTDDEYDEDLYYTPDSYGEYEVEEEDTGYYGSTEGLPPPDRSYMKNLKFGSSNPLLDLLKKKKKPEEKLAEEASQDTEETDAMATTPEEEEHSETPTQADKPRTKHRKVRTTEKRKHERRKHTKAKQAKGENEDDEYVFMNWEQDEPPDRSLYQEDEPTNEYDEEGEEEDAPKEKKRQLRFNKEEARKRFEAALRNMKKPEEETESAETPEPAETPTQVQTPMKQPEEEDYSDTNEETTQDEQNEQKPKQRRTSSITSGRSIERRRQRRKREPLIPVTDKPDASPSVRKESTSHNTNITGAGIGVAKREKPQPRNAQRNRRSVTKPKEETPEYEESEAEPEIPDTIEEVDEETNPNPQKQKRPRPDKKKTDKKKPESKKKKSLPPDYDAAREFGINKGSDRTHEDDEALFDELLRNTTTAAPVVDIKALDEDGWEKKPLIIAKAVEERPTMLGEAISLEAPDEFESLALVQTLIEAQAEEVDHFFEVSAIKQWSSTTDLLKHEAKQKDRMYMFGHVDISQAERVHLQHYCPTLWDTRRGRVRRNSM